MATVLVCLACLPLQFFSSMFCSALLMEGPEAQIASCLGLTSLLLVMFYVVAKVHFDADRILVDEMRELASGTQSP